MWPRKLAAAVGAGGLAATAHAQEVATPEPASRLETVRVTGDANTKKTDLSADPAAFPGSTTRVTQGEIAKQGINSYGDLLRPITGLNLNSFGQGGLGYGISLRGFVDTEHGKDVAVFVDGVPINASSGVQANGYVDLNPLLPETVQSFEVIRGPISSLFGNHALGGTVAFTTASDLPASRIDVSGGSYGTGRVFALGGYAAERWKAYGTLEGHYTSGYRDNNKDRRLDTFDKVTFPLLDGTASVRVQLYDDVYGEPGYINQAAVESGAISARAAVNGTDHGLHQQQNVVFNFAGSGDSYWSSTAYVVHNDLVRTRTSGGLGFPGAGTSQRVDGDERTSFGGDLRRVTSFPAFGVPAELVAGVSLYSDLIDATRFAADLHGNRTVQTQDRDLDIHNPAAYAELQVKPLDRLKLTAGGRYDKFYDDIRTGSSDSIPNLHIEPKPGQFSPKGGAAVTLVDGVDLYGNIARGVKAPSAYDELVSNPNLDVSKLRAYETGVTGQDAAGNWRFVVDLWRSDQTGEVENDPVTGALLNFGRTRRQGFDVEGRFRVLGTAANDVALFANYGRISARLVDAGPGNDFVITVPRYTATAGVDASTVIEGDVAHRIGLYAYDSFIGSKHLDPAGQVNSRPYQRVSAKLTYANSAWKRITAYLSATVYPNSRLAETSFYSGGVVVTSPKAPAIVIGGLTATLD